MNTRIALGAAGESLAAAYLESHELRILERNWRCHAGEIDIVATQHSELVIVEVKTRTGVQFGHPFEAVTPTKLARLYRLGVLWAAQHRWRGPMRIDAISVTFDQAGVPHIEHLRGVSS
ncbi:MAG TPA: YraN family protein [Microbacteriaceae bacterium]|nr:YraN family protein [Microbacteriaceae bacterium]